MSHDLSVWAMAFANKTGINFKILILIVVENYL